MTYTSPGVPVTVPDPGVAFAFLTVSGLAGLVTDLDVQFDMFHTYDSDMIFTLISPDGIRVRLIDRRGGDGDNFFSTRLNDDSFIFVSQGTPPFSGSYAPEEPLAALNGTNPNGVWTLEMRDTAGQDVGTLTDYRIIVTTGEYFRTSDAAGYYQFTNIGPNTTLRAVAPGGFAVSGPHEGSYTVSGGALAATDCDFGLSQAATGFVYHDSNANGVFDFFGVDNFQAGVRVFADGNNNRRLDQAGPFYYDGAGLPVPIPDLNTENAVIPVTGLTGSVNRVVITFSITHTYIGDLTIALHSPNGTRVVLVNRRGGSSDNFIFTSFDDEATRSIADSPPPFGGPPYRPEQPLTAFNGEDPNGEWFLQMTDSAGQDTGSLVFLTLEVYTGERLCAQ